MSPETNGLGVWNSGFATALYRIRNEFECTDIGPITSVGNVGNVNWAGHATLIDGEVTRAAGVNSRAFRQKGVSHRRTPIVAERRDSWIQAKKIADTIAGEIETIKISDEVVPERSEVAHQVDAFFVGSV